MDWRPCIIFLCRPSPSNCATVSAQHSNGKISLTYLTCKQCRCLTPTLHIRAQISSEFPNAHRQNANHPSRWPNNFTSGAQTTAFPRPLPDTTIFLNILGHYCAIVLIGCGGMLFSSYHHEKHPFLCPECISQEIQESAMGNPHRSFGKQQRQRNLRKDVLFEAAILANSKQRQNISQSQATPEWLSV